MFDLAIEFMRIFSGHEEAHGEYVITGESGLKKTGKARTVKESVTVDHWEAHLKGEKALGIIPINKSNQCVWGCVDIDQYDGLDLEELSRLLPEQVTLCRSKSGGAHLFIFMQTQTTAVLMRKKLKLLALAVGHPSAEIFPKQDILENNGVGNWLNMPYFSEDSTLRYCIRNNMHLTAKEFVEHVAEYALTVQELVVFNPIPINDSCEDSEFSGAPPCIQQLTKIGFPVGSRNHALFSLGVFAKKKYENGWEDKIGDYNTRFMSGTYSEVAGIIRSLKRTTYTYKCKEQPLCNYCDREICASMEFGISLKVSEEKIKRPSILDMVTCVKCYEPPKTSKDEPYWIFTIDECELEVTMDMALNQRLFAREYFRQYHKIVLPIKDDKWRDAINTLMASAEKFEMAPDAGPEGQLMIHLEDFCTNKSQAKSKDELILGKPWVENGRVYFRSSDLIRFLDLKRFKPFKESEIYIILQRHGAKHHRLKLKGKTIDCWSVIAYEEQIERFASEEFKDENSY